MIKKSTIACLVCSALSAFVSTARAEALVVRPGGSDQINPPNNTVTYDSITFKTQGQDFEKFLGKDKNIDVLNVTNGLTLNNDAGGGKTVFNISAKEVSIGGISYGDFISPIQTTGSILNIEANTFKSEVTKGKALTASGGTTINLGSTNNFIDQVVLSTKDDTSAIYASGEGNIAIFGNTVRIDAASSNSYAAPIYVTGDSHIDVNAKENLEITNAKASAVIAQKGGGTISLKSDGTLNVNGKEDNKAIWLQQSDGHLGAINVKGNDISLTGYVEASVNNKSLTNGIFLEADNLIKVTANVDSSSFWAAAIHATDNGYIRFTSKDLEINNQSTGERSVGIFLEKKDSEFLGNFSNTATINAMTGIFAKADNSKFTLNGNAQAQSLLTINSSFAGVVAQTGNNSVNDTSVAININYDKNVNNPWAPPSGTNGITGLGSYGKGDLLLSNVDSKDKTLSIAVNTSSEYNQDADIITSAISTQGDGQLTVKNFETVNLSVVNMAKKATRHGLYAKSGHIQITEGIGNVFITTTNGNAIFTKKYVNQKDPKDYDPGVIDLTAKNITLTDLGEKGVGLNSEKGTINVVASDSLSINAKEAIKAQSKESLINVDAKTSTQSLIKGDWSVNEGKATVALGTSAVVEGKLQADKLGTIDLSLGKLGTLQGSTATDFEGDGTGTVNLTMTNGSVWNVTEDSTASVLTLTDSTIDFSRWKTTTKAVDAQNYNSVKSKTFTGDNNTLRMQIDLANETKDKVLTDQLNITGKALGTHTADLKIDGKDLVPNKFHSENWLISQGADSNMSILNKEGKNQYSGRGMVTTWGLAFVANGEEDKLNSAEGLSQLVGNTTGKGEGKWYLVRNDEEIVDPNPNPNPGPDPKPEQPGPNDPAEMQEITNLGISATQALSFASELEDLRSRLGEVRYGAQDGAWVRAGYAKETADGYNGRGFEQKTHDLHIGLDRIVAADEDSSWLVGGALRYAKSKQEGFTAARGGEGELEQYSAKLYATYMHAQGSYADFVVQAGRYSQDLTGLANDLSSAFKADYKTYGYGASVEIGHMFDFNNQVDDRQWFNHFFIEPQLQLSYFNAHGKDYKTSTGLAVSQSDADFLTGRAGVVLGKKFNYGTVDDLDKRYFQVGLKGGVKYEFLGDQTIRFTGVERVTKERKADDVDGARYYYGVTADWQLSHNFRAYATVEREEGDHYTKDFDVSVGVKYQF